CDVDETCVDELPCVELPCVDGFGPPPCCADTVAASPNIAIVHAKIIRFMVCSYPAGHGLVSQGAYPGRTRAPSRCNGGSSHIRNGRIRASRHTKLTVPFPPLKAPYSWSEGDQKGSHSDLPGRARGPRHPVQRRGAVGFPRRELRIPAPG